MRVAVEHVRARRDDNDRVRSGPVHSIAGEMVYYGPTSQVASLTDGQPYRSDRTYDTRRHVIALWVGSPNPSGYRTYLPGTLVDVEVIDR